MADKILAYVNGLEPTKFGVFLERVVNSLPLAPNARAQDVFSVEERDKLMKVFGLHSAADVSALIDWSVDVFQKAGFEQTKAEILKRRLEERGVKEEVAETILRVWCSQGRAFVDRLKCKTLAGRSLEDVNFVLNVEIASQNRAQINQPTISLQLVTEKCDAVKENLVVELDHGQSLRLYDTLEEIQKQIDTLTG